MVRILLLLFAMKGSGRKEHKNNNYEKNVLTNKHRRFDIMVINPASNHGKIDTKSGNEGVLTIPSEFHTTRMKSKSHLTGRIDSNPTKTHSSLLTYHPNSVNEG